MFRPGLRALCLTLLLAAAGFSTPASADPPSYFPSYVLMRPSGGAAQMRPLHAGSPGYAVPVQSGTYSYGWFGATRKIHRTPAPYGYYGNYAEFPRQ
jgi:hypothetical protein